jgi:hypothetical protein
MRPTATVAKRCPTGLQARVNRLAFESEDAEDTLVYQTQTFTSHETGQCLKTERELAQPKRSLR